MTRTWHIKNQELPLGERTLIMGILNVTPDSFSDGGRYLSHDRAIEHAQNMIADGADVIDVGGESTRPGGEGPVSAEDEIARIIPVIEALTKLTKVPISVDTTKSEVAKAALDSGASIVNDISALRFDYFVADVVAKQGAGLVLMHSRGTPATLHKLPPVADIMDEVKSSLRASIKMAERRGVARDSIAIDPGIGFGKSQEQNLQLLGKLRELRTQFGLPLLLGTSRKSFIGRVLADEDGTPASASERLHGTMVTITVAVLSGVEIVRVHDVKAAAETIRVAESIKKMSEIV